MSKIKPEHAYATEHFDRFHGLGKSPLTDSKKATDIRNFRITANGSLEKRRGYRALRKFPEQIRAYWEGSVGSNFYQMAICGNKVYSIDIMMGTLEVIATLNSRYAYINFIQFENELYLLDSNDILVFRPSLGKFLPVTASDAYVPLYGKDWDPVSGGETFESVNLLSNRIRVSYLNVSRTNTFKLPFYASAIDSILVDGVPVTSYGFTTSDNTVYIPAATNGYQVEIGFEIALDINNSEISTASQSIVYPGRHHPTLFLYGDIGSSKIYRSAYISSESLKQCRAHYPNCTSLYFRGEDVLFAGDKQYPLTAISLYNNRLLVYSKIATWEIRCSDNVHDEVDISPLLQGIGCISPHAAITCGNYPVIVNNGGVYLLDFPTSGNDLPDIVKISDDISDHLTTSFLYNCIAREDILHHELWLRDPKDSEAKVLVYNLDHREWYVFDNIYATRFFSLPLYDGFLSGDELLVFDENIGHDNGADIVASYQSGYFSLGHPTSKKRSLRTSLCADTNGNSPFLKIETEHTERTFELVGSDLDVPEFFDYRALMGRFRFLRFRLLVSGKKDCRFHTISFYANL